MSVSDAVLTCTYEPSGEVRLSLRVPDLHGNRGKRRFAAGSQAAGCGALVYSRKVGEKPEKRGGMGALGQETIFGRAAKRNIKNAVGTLKALYGRQIVFATVTLPGSTDSARKAVAAWSAKAIELLTHFIRYTAPGADYCYVWERQKSGALHLHAAIGSRDVLALRRLERGFKGYIYRLFSTLSEKSGVDMFARADGGSWKGCPEVLRSNCVPVRKCVKRYMAKYITKGAGVLKGYSPARWWGIGRALRAAIGSYRRCTRLQISVWAIADTTVEKARRSVAGRGYTAYEFSLPFSPMSRTFLVYPPEDEAEDVYAALVLLCENSNEDLTDALQNDRRPVSMRRLLATVQ